MDEPKQISKGLYYSVAALAGACGGSRIVTAPGQAVVHAQFNSGLDDLRLCHVDEGSNDPNRILLRNSSLGSEPCSLGKGVNEFRPAVWITAVIDGIDTDKNR